MKSNPKISLWLWGPILIIFLASMVKAVDRVHIMVPDKAGAIEQYAARELAHYLKQMYPGASYVINRKGGLSPAGLQTIYLGTVQDTPAVLRENWRDTLKVPGSYAAKSYLSPNSKLAVIVGADSRALLQAVYAWLEKLGCGFYLSYSQVPVYPDRSFPFESLNFEDAPVFSERIVFNWHNFLSSCSTWDLPQWQDWIDQSCRLRYSGVMVHAYGNNPMVSYTHNGRSKPVGYLTTTIQGRDWGTQHVNDVRRLIGGAGMFDEPVFGCTAAKVPDAERATAAKKLMKQVFAHARNRGMDVYFALDVDTASSNPPNVIQTLPVEARLSGGGHPLANPDTPAGYAFYRTQIQTLLQDYPQITHLIVWHRALNRTPWRKVKVEDFPEAWKDEYQKMLARHPGAEKLRDSPSMFAIAKIAKAFRRALNEIDRAEVRLGTGTWNFSHLKAADIFMPKEVGFYPLDWIVKFDTDPIKNALSAVGDNRPMIPIVWAHHDDHRYVGRCYTPYANFTSQLHQCNAKGFGIIHWTTRPLDLYFKSLAQQTWQSSKNESLSETCRQMAERTFRPSHQDLLGRYLEDWITKAPQFGRETSDRFIDRALDNPQQIIQDCQRRLAMLKEVDITKLEPQQREWLDYYREMEQFFIEFYQGEQNLQKSRALLKQGDAAGAQVAIKAAQPENVIERYSRACQKVAISRGEQALVISLNLRWLPYFIAQRQALGLEPIQINFQPTQHDPLAQGAGHRTFYVDQEKNFWLGLGNKETGIDALTDTTLAGSGGHQDKLREIKATFLESTKPFTIRLKNMVGRNLTSGTYQVNVYFRDNSRTAKTQFDLTLKGGKNSQVSRKNLRMKNESYGVSLIKLEYEIKITQGNLEVQCRPQNGPLQLAAITITKSK